MLTVEKKRKKSLGLRRYEGNFVEDGFTIIRNAIPIATQKKIQKTVIETLKNQAGKFGKNIDHSNDYSVFIGLIQILTNKHKPYDFLKPVWDNLVHERLIKKIFTEKIVFDFVSNILGKDLCHQDDPSLTLNLPGISTSSQNYLFKGFHQEVWSGADVHSIQFWTPLFALDNAGGIVLVKGSHLWGHIPHRDREPVWLPKNYDEIYSNLEIGDVIVFHPLLLHRTAPIKSEGQPRLALPCLLKNFKIQNNSFEIYRNWKIFSYSDLSQIDRRLGNHYLSPYRLLGIDKGKQEFDGGIE